MMLAQWDNLPQNWADLNRKFSGTFVFGIVPEVQAAPQVYEIIEIGEQHATVRFRSGDHNTHELARWTTMDVIHPYPPQLGAIPFFNKVLFIQRNPARQWHVGMNRQNTILLNHRLLPVVIGHSEAKALYQPEYRGLSVQDAVTAMEGNADLEAIAINRHYWLARRDDKIRLYHGRLPLGSFTFGGFFIHKGCRDLSQELWDDLRLKV